MGAINSTDHINAREMAVIIQFMLGLHSAGLPLLLKEL